METLQQSEEYIQRVNELTEEDVTGEDFFERERYLRVTSNIRNLMGLEDSNALGLYKKIIKAKSRSYNDQVLFDSRWVKDSRIILDSTPKIYVTFHVGSYRIINHLLLENQISYCLAVTKDVLSDQGDAYSELHEKLLASKSTAADFKIVDAEEKASIIQMIKLVKSGYSLLFYADGNSGLGGMTRSDDKLMEITFLRKQIMVRKGIAYLSHLLGLPIVPILSGYDDDYVPGFTVYDAISPDQNQQRDEYISRATKRLWTILEDHLKIYAGQWEGWLYVNEFIVGKPENEAASEPNEDLLFFNSDRYEVYRKTDYFIFDKYKVESYLITAALFKLIAALKRSGMAIGYTDAQKILPPKLFTQLITSRILK